MRMMAKTPGVPRRNTLFPRVDFVVRRLTTEAVDQIFKQIMAAGLKQDIIHVVITRNGATQFGAYDNFHPDCVVVSNALPLAVLEQLKRDGIVRCTAW